MYKAQTLCLALVALMLTHFAASIMLDIKKHNQRRDVFAFHNAMNKSSWFRNSLRNKTDRSGSRRKAKRWSANNSTNDAVSCKSSVKSVNNSDKSHDSSRQDSASKSRSTHNSSWNNSDKKSSSVSKHKTWKRHHNRSRSGVHKNSHYTNDSRNKREIANLQRKIRIHADMISKLRNLVTKLKKLVEQLEHNDKTNRSRIQKLTNQLNESHVKVERLEREVSEKNQRIKQLEAELKSREKFWKNENEKQKQNFEEQIKKLQKKLSGLDGNHHKKDSTIIIGDARE